MQQTQFFGEHITDFLTTEPGLTLQPWTQRSLPPLSSQAEVSIAFDNDAFDFSAFVHLEDLSAIQLDHVLAEIPDYGLSLPESHDKTIVASEHLVGEGDRHESASPNDNCKCLATPPATSLSFPNLDPDSTAADLDLSIGFTTQSAQASHEPTSQGQGQMAASCADHGSFGRSLVRTSLNKGDGMIEMVHVNDGKLR